MRLPLLTFFILAFSSLHAQVPEPNYIISSDSCTGKILYLKVASTKGIRSYYWQCDDPYSTLGNNYRDSICPHLFNKAGNYDMRVTLNYGYRTVVLKKTLHIDSCVKAITNDCKPLQASEFISGQGKGFRITSACEFEQYKLTIYDRWGVKVFESSNPQEEWNGLANNTGAVCKEGTYYYNFTHRFKNAEPAPAINSFLKLLTAAEPAKTCTMSLDKAFFTARKPLFGPRSSCLPLSYKFEVFSRWGETMFVSEDTAKKWNGNDDKGRICPNGIYICKVQYRFKASDSLSQISESITLVRENIAVNPYDTCTVDIPDAYTPGPAAFNIGSSCPFKKYKLYIYDSFGKLLFSSKNPAEQWNGTDRKGAPYVAGIYVCILEYSFTGSNPLKKKEGIFKLAR